MFFFWDYLSDQHNNSIQNEVNLHSILIFKEKTNQPTRKLVGLCLVMIQMWGYANKTSNKVTQFIQNWEFKLMIKKYAEENKIKEETFLVSYWLLTSHDPCLSSCL